MASYSDIQHRFANKLEGKRGCISASSCRYEGRNFYSYSTVFGQWLDMEKNVVAIFDGHTSTSSSKHKLYKGLFPDDVHVFPLCFSGRGYYGWSNCNLVSEYNFSDEDFKEYHRMQMIDHYVGRIYNRLAAINGGTRKGLENVSFEAWGYIEELCSLYKDTSIAKYLKWTKNKDYKKLVKLLKAGERNVETLTDALFGKGTYKTYWDYCARYRKAADKRAKVEALCKRIGICSPYENRWSYSRLDSGLTADQIRKLSAKERLDLHFASIMRNEERKAESAAKDKYNRNFRNAYKWIVGFEPQKEYWGGYDNKVKNNCINKDSGVVYECSGEYIYRFYWCDTNVSFDYEVFRNSEDKEQWIADFYAKCEEVALNRKAISIIRRINAHTKEKEHSYDDDVYLNDDYLRESTTEAEYIICSEFIKKQDKHFADEAARRRAAEIERLRREEEERKEREYMEQVKKEQIEECIARGSKGCRDLWRKHLCTIETSEATFDDAKIADPDGDFFYDGNVLLRLNLNKDKVETSKYIKIPVETCKRMWKIVSKWHENPSCFKPMEIDTKGSGKYTISSYKNDILTAGCHKIAYVEMERMYNEIAAV